MTQRHLTPDEIDHLLDDETDLGAAPLRAHIDECATCRAQLDDARVVLRALDTAPRLSPSNRFTDQVMNDVSVLVPWHVAVRDTVVALVPRSRPARIGASIIGLGSAALVSAALVWILTETDLLVFASTVAGSRLRTLVVNTAGQIVVTLFGRQALAVFMQSGLVGLFVVLLGFLGATVGALASLRAIAVAAGRRRS